MGRCASRTKAVRPILINIYTIFLFVMHRLFILELPLRTWVAFSLKESGNIRYCGYMTVLPRICNHQGLKLKWTPRVTTVTAGVYFKGHISE